MKGTVPSRYREKMLFQIGKYIVGQNSTSNSESESIQKWYVVRSVLCFLNMY